MKTIKQLGSLGLAMLTLSTISACNISDKKKPIELIARARETKAPIKDNIVQIALLLDTSNSICSTVVVLVVVSVVL